MLEISQHAIAALALVLLSCLLRKILMSEYVLMTAEEVGKLFRVDARTVNERYAYRGDFPKFIKVGARKLWKRTELMKYIDDMQQR